MITRPDITEGTHPVEQDKTLVSTPQIAETLKVIGKWTKRRKTGGMIFGVPRVGKDRGITYIIKAKEADPDDFLYEYANMRSLSVSTEKSFWTHLLGATNYAVDHSSSSAQMWQQLSIHLASKIINTDKKGLILFINDAQKLNTQQFDMLHDLHNEIVDQGIYACFVLVGHLTLLEKRNRYVTKKPEVVGRFMTDEFHMRGVRNEVELATILQGYDKERPETACAEGWPYSKFFFPEDFMAGWRLEHEAKVLWRAFELVHEKERLPKSLEPRLQDVIHTINGAFLEYTKKDGTHFKFNQAIWMTAIKDAGYASAGNYIKEKDD